MYRGSRLQRVGPVTGADLEYGGVRRKHSAGAPGRRPKMNVLIAVASRHGSTVEIAATIAEELRQAGHKVDVRNVDDEIAVRLYDAAIIGSAVYMGHWLAEARHFLDREREHLRAMPVWLFSSGPKVRTGQPNTTRDKWERSGEVALERKIQLTNVTLTPVEERRIERHLDRLERRLTHYPSPSVTLVLRQRPMPRQVDVDMQVHLTPGGTHLISHQTAETADHAVALAIDDVLRAYERHRSTVTHEPSYGVPSRREPRAHRQPSSKSPGTRDDEISPTAD
jgi:flavodoxin